MDRRCLRGTIFTLLMLLAPTPLVMIQVFMVLPAVFFPFALLYLLIQAFEPGQARDSLAFAGIFAVHLLIIGGLWYLLARLLAATIERLETPQRRRTALAVFCAGIVALAFAPFYGSGGHGATEWVGLPGLFAELARDYGTVTVILIYGVALLLYALLCFGRRRRRIPAGR